jgi:hypothetical protein
MRGEMLLKTVLVVFWIFIAPIFSSAQEKPLVLKSATIDGIADEWANSQINYNSTTKLSYAITNDRTNLYILIKSADQPTNAKILANSLRISINAKGKKRVKTSLTFPLIERDALSRGRQFRASRDEKPTPPGSDIRNEVLSNATTMQLHGFSRIPDGTFSVDLINTYGIKAAAKFDGNKVLTYELSVPLSQLNISPGQAKAIAYQIKINGAADPSDDSSRYNDNRRVPGGNGGIPSGGGMIPGISTRGIPGMGGTIRVGSAQRPSSRPIDNFKKDRFNTNSASFWVKYSLAKTKL